MERGLPTRLSPAEGRKFAFTVGSAFLVISAIAWWRAHAVPAATMAIVGGTLLLLGLVIPGRLGPIHRAWMGLALLISKVTTPIFMGITYFLVLSPIGIVMRLFGRNPIVHEPTEGSFWMRRADGPKRRSDLTRQF